MFRRLLIFQPGGTTRLDSSGEAAMSAKTSSNDVKMNEVIDAVKARGWITYDEASGSSPRWARPRGPFGSFLRRTRGRRGRGHGQARQEPQGDRRRATKAAEKTNLLSAEPVQTYLDWMGAVSLLTREGEVELARQIEKGRQIDLRRGRRARVARSTSSPKVCERVTPGSSRFGKPSSSRASKRCSAPSTRTSQSCEEGSTLARRPRRTLGSQRTSFASCTKP